MVKFINKRYSYHYVAYTETANKEVEFENIFKIIHNVSVKDNVFYFIIRCDVSRCHYTKYDCTGDLCSPMQIIPNQFAFQQSIQCSWLPKYCQSLMKCNNCRQCTPVDHTYVCYATNT
jgi:hypothetical protein